MILRKSRTVYHYVKAKIMSSRALLQLFQRLFFNSSIHLNYIWLTLVNLTIVYNIFSISGRSVFWELNYGNPFIWLTLDILCDFIYLVDIFVHMHEGYCYEELSATDAEQLHPYSYSNINAAVDVISTLPIDYMIYVWWPWTSCNAKNLPCSPIVRINRLLRLPRMLKWFSRTKSTVCYLLCKLLFALLVFVHLKACIIFYLSHYRGSNFDFGDSNVNNDSNNMFQNQYIQNIFESLMSLILMESRRTPTRLTEYLYACINVVAHAYIIFVAFAYLRVMIWHNQRIRFEFQYRLNGIKQYLAAHNVPHDLRKRMFNWFNYSWSPGGVLEMEHRLDVLPDQLKAEVKLHVYKETLASVEILQCRKAGLLEELILKMKLQVFGPDDYVCRKGDTSKGMYIVHKGLLHVLANDGISVVKRLHVGAFFGEMSILDMARNQSLASVRSKRFSQLIYISKKNLLKVMIDYPEFRAKLALYCCQLLRYRALFRTPIRPVIRLLLNKPLLEKHI